MISLKRLLIQLASCCVFVLVVGQVWGQEGTLRLSLSCESVDGRVSLGKPTTFTATVQNRTDKPVTAILRWDVHAVAFAPPEPREREIRIGGGQSDSFEFELTCTAAGFADVEVGVTHNKKTLSAHSRIVNAPEEVRSALTKEPDFDEFWVESLRQLAKVLPEFEAVARPDLNSEKADVFEVKFRSLGDVRVAGWLEVPRKPGPHPVVIRVPGYGQNMRPIDRWNDLMVFSFNPRGHGNSTEDIPGKPGDYWIRGLDDKANYFYRGAYLDCVRAVDYIASRDDVDQNRIAVWGGSQGGGFAFATAALDSRVDLCVADIPFLCDWVNYFKLSHWPEMDKWIAASPTRNWKSTLRTLSYFDTMNLNDRIQCPTIMGVGLQDKICPPTTSFAAFNRIPAKTSYKIYKDAGHGLGKKHWDWVWKTIRDDFNLNRQAQQ